MTDTNKAASPREELDGEIFSILKATFPGNAQGVAQALSCIRNLIAQANPVKAASPEGEAVAWGWVMTNANGDKFRAWQNGGTVWVSDPVEATYYARRVDAEAVHLDDDGAWRVHFRPIPNASPQPKGWPSPPTSERAEVVADTQAELEMLRVALVDAVHRMHPTPQYMLPRGLGMSMGPGLTGDDKDDSFGVIFRAGDGSKQEVRVTRGLLDAVTVALDAEDVRRTSRHAPAQQAPLSECYAADSEYETAQQVEPE